MTQLTVVEPAPRRGLTTPSRYRDAAPAVDIDDEALDRLIGRCSAMVETWCNRTFARERVIEVQRLEAPTLVLLTRTPVVTVHEFLLANVEIALGAWTLDDPAAGVIRLARSERHDEFMWRALGGPRLYDRDLLTAPAIYAIEYVGGYLLPDESGDGNLPPDIEHAAQLVVRGELDLRNRGALGITAERLGDASRSYAAAGSGSPGMVEAKTILAPYKRYAL